MDLAASKPVIGRLTAPIRARLAVFAQLDSELVRNCQKGDDDAFKAMVLKYQDTVFGVSFRILGNRDDAYEAGQETFIAAYEAIKGFRGDSSLKTWLTKIATRQALKIIAKRNTWEELGSDCATGSDNAAESAINSELSDALTKALLSLSPSLRSAFVLRELEGLSYREIADCLDISIGTVESRLHRARSFMRAALSSHTQGDDYV